tara:strand:+ start:2043 stop:3023 length:981 start_codon:yes stop_codon:yes gene_type:complete
MNKFTCVTIGDLDAIGIRILLDLYKEKKIKNFILFTNKKIIFKFFKKIKSSVKINIVNEHKNDFNYEKNKLNIFNFKADNKHLNTILSIKNSYIFCLKYKQKGIITLPVNKSKVKKNIKNFTGHTEFFEKLDNIKISNMIFIYNQLLISTLTTHIAINKIYNKIRKKNYIYDKIITLNKSLIKDFNIKKPKIIISGLNPHASENNNIGNEEQDIIIPQLKKLRKININIDGPISGDALLVKKNLNKYNCFVYIFHDQALIPFKYISQFQGINYTSNLKMIRLSPDHGTGYELIKNKKYSCKSVLNCFKYINKIYKNKLNWKQQKNR